MQRLASLLPLLACVPALAAQADKLDRGLPDGDAAAPVFVRMKDQLFPTGKAFTDFCKSNAARPRRALRKELVADLQARADASFKAVQETLTTLGADVTGLQRYWVVNGFACRATGKACRALAALDAVGFVYAKPNRVPPLLAPQARNDAVRERRDRQVQPLVERALAELKKGTELGPKDVETLAPTISLERIRAAGAWREGAMGQGVTIALLDSGLAPAPALLQALWRNEKETLDGKDNDGNGYVDDLFGYDFQSDYGISLGDPQGHGTMCGGIMAARPVEVDGKRLVTGVAPRARLMVLRGMGLLKSYEYALQMGADVVSMSYMWVGIELGNWRGIYRLAHEHMTAAGIVSVGGSGNFGPGSQRAAPAGKQICLPKDIPCVISASGLDAGDDKLPGFSSLGPCTWSGVKFYDDFPPDQPLHKPDVTTYSTGFPCWVQLRGRVPRRAKVVHKEGNFGLVIGPAGNSFAGPHAGGVAALMLSANPDLPAWKVKELMESTCRDLGEEGRDSKYGAGMVDAAAAVAAARAAAKR